MTTTRETHLKDVIEKLRTWQHQLMENEQDDTANWMGPNLIAPLEAVLERLGPGAKSPEPEDDLGTIRERIGEIMSGTAPSWGWRVSRMLSALGLDYGDADSTDFAILRAAHRQIRWDPDALVAAVADKDWPPLTYAAPTAPVAASAEKPAGYRWSPKGLGLWSYGPQVPHGAAESGFDIQPLAPVAASAVDGRATHRHVKRGSLYRLLGIGKMQAEEWVAPSFGPDGPRGLMRPVDMEPVAVYVSEEDGSMWVRPREEFEDGRFEAVSSAPNPVADDPAAKTIANEPRVREIAEAPATGDFLCQNAHGDWLRVQRYDHPNHRDAVIHRMSGRWWKATVFLPLPAAGEGRA